MEEKIKKSIEQTVYEKLKYAILHRTIAPGTQLVESSISDKMKISRTPIRYAIKRLATEGFVTIIPNRGAFIIKPTTEEIFQAFTVRIELECISLKYAEDNIDDKDIEVLYGLVEKEAAALNDKNYMDYFAYNKEFHMMMARKTNNKFLIEFLDKIIDQINIYLLVYNAYYSIETEDLNIQDHQNMVELIKNKSFDKLDSILREHLSSSLNELKLNKMNYKSLDEIFE